MEVIEILLQENVRHVSGGEDFAGRALVTSASR
jgi:hypothetical protein